MNSNLEKEVDVSLNFPNELSNSDWSLTQRVLTPESIGYISFDFKITIVQDVPSGSKVKITFKNEITDRSG